jgi:hypothetical protein
MFIFATHARALLESFLVVVFALATAEASSARRTPIIMLPPVPSPSPPPRLPALPV